MVTGLMGRDGEDGSKVFTGSCRLYQNEWQTVATEEFLDRLNSCGGVAATLEGFGTYGVVRAYNQRTSS
jgi:hypothetical protein